MNELIYRGIIIRQSDYGEAHRMLWIFTESDGIIKAVRYGIRGRKASNAAAFQLFSYGDFKLRPSRGDIMTAVSADILDGFYPVSEDIIKLSLLSYLAEITHVFTGESNPDGRMLALFLNTVYAAAYRSEPYLKLKAVYELKLMCAAGYKPKLSDCAVCGGEPAYFSPSRGSLVCAAHRISEDVPVSGSALALMRYISDCPDKRMLSFTAPDESCYAELCDITESYVAVQADREFKSLAYLKGMIGHL